MDIAVSVTNLKINESKNLEQKWDINISPSTALFKIDYRELWNYRDLLSLIVKRDFISFYKQTIFGPLWIFIQPVFTTILFTLVFNKMGGFSTENIPAPLFYMCGTIAWNFFADCFTKTSTVFKDNAAIFGKVYFPRLIMPLSIIFSSLIRFGVQLILFIILLIYFMTKNEIIYFNEYIILFPIVLAQMAFLGLGLGLIITALTTKYRDLAFLVSFGVQLLMYASPVIYSLSATPEKYRLLIILNPLSGIIETFRYGITGSGQFFSLAFVYSIFATFIILFVGILIFNKVEKSFIDTV